MFHLYIDGTGWGGTLIAWRFAFRWGSHAHYFRGYHVQWYGDKGWKFFWHV